MRSNSEIRKYIWLDFTPQRTIAMPLVLFAIFFLVHLWFGDSNKPDRLYEMLHSVSSTLFWLLATIWGSYKAAHSVADDIRSNCWDNIRLSPISAADLCFGKLIGSTLYTWYGAIPVLAVYSISLAQLHGTTQALYSVYAMIMSVIFTHALIIVLMLRGAHACNSRHAPSVIGVFVLGLFVGGTLENVATAPLFMLKWFDKSAATADWFGYAIPTPELGFLTMSALCLWALIGLFRSSREILQHRSKPYVWVVFILFWIVYAMGFAHTPLIEHFAQKDVVIAGYQRTSVLIAFSISLWFTYVALFIQRTSLTDYRRMGYAYSRKQFGKLMETVPLWLVTFAMVVLCYFLLVLSFVGLKAIGSYVVTLSSLSLLFLVRDIGIVTFAQLAPNARRAGLAAVFYLLVLYGLLPAILLHGKLESMSYFFYPFAKEGASFAVITPVLLQCAVVGAMVLSRANALRLEKEKSLTAHAGQASA